MEFNGFGITLAGKRSLGATRSKSSMAALCGYRTITTCTSSDLLITFYNTFFPKLASCFLIVLSPYKSMQPSDFFFFFLNCSHPEDA